MMEDLARWFPLRRFALCADGFYAPLAGKNLPRTHSRSLLFYLFLSWCEQKETSLCDQKENNARCLLPDISC